MYCLDVLLSLFVFPCPVLTVASWPAYRFLKKQVRWSGIPISKNFSQFVMIHTVKGFGIVNKAEIDVFLELSCFFENPVDVDNLISGSSAFSKTSLNIWKFTVHILSKPGLENFEHYFRKEYISVYSSCLIFFNTYTQALYYIWHVIILFFLLIPNHKLPMLLNIIHF